ncbi:hypothetical protein MLD38_024179 [Melastoma candidum]|uniref:Uncharacterized protein n=1 Tax=Melastoma candidum TaxID=119954 RepID=A0ACB9NSE2_9MYRT|nr:hypothetical protein MLD38_024179 [Melastoma candidum]
MLLKRVGDIRKASTGEDLETPLHHSAVLDVSDPGSGDPTGALPFVLQFNNLTYSVKVRRKVSLPVMLPRTRSRLGPVVSEPAAIGEGLFMGTKVLLDDISGEVRNGEILAVLGAIGSGKSTLVDALANRIATGSLLGLVTLNGEALESRMLKVILAYVMQDDLLFPMLTVKEKLMFAAEFHLPRSLSKLKKKLRVQALIDQLGLRNAASKTVIGDEGHRGVSGGEHRRASIGSDVVHDPIVLFLDELTSGLDSTSAFRIVESGSIVVMTVHQPSYRILGLLDRLLFLSHGQTVYRGSPANLPSFFAEFGHLIPENEKRTMLDLIRELEGPPGESKAWWNSTRCGKQPRTTTAAPSWFGLPDTPSRRQSVRPSPGVSWFPVPLLPRVTAATAHPPWFPPMQIRSG